MKEKKKMGYQPHQELKNWVTPLTQTTYKVGFTIKKWPSRYRIKNTVLRSIKLMIMIMQHEFKFILQKDKITLQPWHELRLLRIFRSCWLTVMNQTCRTSQAIYEPSRNASEHEKRGRAMFTSSLYLSDLIFNQPEQTWPGVDNTVGS